MAVAQLRRRPGVHRRHGQPAPNGARARMSAPTTGAAPGPAGPASGRAVENPQPRQQVKDVGLALAEQLCAEPVPLHLHDPEAAAVERSPRAAQDQQLGSLDVDLHAGNDALAKDVVERRRRAALDSNRPSGIKHVVVIRGLLTERDLVNLHSGVVQGHVAPEPLDRFASRLHDDRRRPQVARPEWIGPAVCADVDEEFTFPEVAGSGRHLGPVRPSGVHDVRLHLGVV